MPSRILVVDGSWIEDGACDGAHPARQRLARRRQRRGDGFARGFLACGDSIGIGGLDFRDGGGDSFTRDTSVMLLDGVIGLGPGEGDEDKNGDEGQPVAREEQAHGHPVLPLIAASIRA